MLDIVKVRCVHVILCHIFLWEILRVFYYIRLVGVNYLPIYFIWSFMCGISPHILALRSYFFASLIAPQPGVYPSDEDTGS